MRWPAESTRPGRARAACALLGPLLLLAACGPTAARPAGADRPRPTFGEQSRAPAPAIRAALAARSFLSLFAQRRYAAQWAELAPPARAQWPSAEARRAMLVAKFAAPAARVVGIVLGRPTPAVVWVSREDPAQRQLGWGVPASVRFAAPQELQPDGVAALYQHLELVVVPGPGGRRFQVLGEGPASLDAPILVPPGAPDRTTRVPILMYHRVGPYPTRAEWSSAYGYQLEMGLTVPPLQFAAEMALLRRQHAHAISLTRLADALLYGLPLPAHPVALTFDDGRLSPYRYAVPVLRRDGFTATFFMPAGFIGAINGPQHYLTVPDLAQLAAGGFWVEDHTVYDNLALWGLTTAQVDQLAGGSAARIERHTGAPIQFIAYSGLWPYPSSQQAGPAETQLFGQLARLGYVGGAVDASVGGVVETTRGLWQLPRLRVVPGESPAGFAQLVDQG
ncbi:MAG TPA: polysaccharide deacetylase family protein [Verrucomicrobiae bacterium]|nr:polysaccharide deacetylase family protein [Verrucomicrobiae bacterium]